MHLCLEQTSQLLTEDVDSHNVIKNGYTYMGGDCVRNVFASLIRWGSTLKRKNSSSGRKIFLLNYTLSKRGSVYGNQSYKSCEKMAENLPTAFIPIKLTRRKVHNLKKKKMPAGICQSTLIPEYEFLSCWQFPCDC